MEVPSVPHQMTILNLNSHYNIVIVAKMAIQNPNRQ